MTRTRAMATATEGNCGTFRLNVIGREPEGSVEGSQVGQWLSIIEDRLRAIELPDGAPLVTAVYRSADYLVRPRVPRIPGWAQTPWHQDDAYGERLFRRIPVITAWIPLVPATRANGCVEVVRGSHQVGVLRHRSLEGPYRHGLTDDAVPAGDRVACEADVGDVVLLHQQIVHRTLPNETSGVRWSIDSRYSTSGAPTGRDVPGFVARSARHPERVSRSHEDWLATLANAGVSLSEGEPTGFVDGRLQGPALVEDPERFARFPRVQPRAQLRYRLHLALPGETRRRARRFGLL